MARKGKRGLKKTSAVRPGGLDVMGGGQHRTTAAIITSEPGSKGRRRERQAFPGYGAPLPWGASSGAQNEGISELKQSVGNPDIPAQDEIQKADNPLQSNDLEQLHGGASAASDNKDSLGATFQEHPIRCGSTNNNDMLDIATDGEQANSADQSVPKPQAPVMAPSTAVSSRVMTFQVIAHAGGQPAHGLKRTVSAPCGCRAYQPVCIPEATEGDSWVVRVHKYAARTVLTALKTTSAGVKLLLRTAWATATQLFRMATAPLRWAFRRHAANRHTSNSTASAGAEVNSVVAAVVDNTPLTTNPAISQPVEAAEPAQPLLRARSAPPVLAHQLESAVPMPSSPAPSSPAPRSPAPVPAVPAQLAINLENGSAATLLDSALSVPTSPLAMPTMQPEPAVNLDDSPIPVQPAIATDALPAPAAVEVQPSAAALLESAIPVPASPQPAPAVPIMPAVVPSMPLAVPEHAGKCTRCNSHSVQAARGAFSTGLCWYHLDLVAEEETAQSRTFAPTVPTMPDEVPIMQLAAPESVVPILPAMVPIVQPAVPEPIDKCTRCSSHSVQAARGAFGTGLCWFHLELEAEEEAALEAAITPSQGHRAGHQRDAAPVRALQGRPPRVHSNSQTGPRRSSESSTTPARHSAK